MSQLHQISGCDNPAREADVVFVHGLGGDPFTTWRNGEDESTSWPHWLGNDFPDVGVWSLGYAASPTRWTRLKRLVGRGSRDSGYSMPLPDRALQVLDFMAQKGIGERPLLFICHSLGGLLAKQILRTADDATTPGKHQIADRTRAVLFLATPHAGAELASLLNRFRTVFGTTVNIEDLRLHDAHLRNLYNWYRNHAPELGIQTCTYFETRGIGGVLPIVDPTSAHPGTGEDPVGLDEDHLSISKPRAPDAQVCSAASSLLRQYVLASPSLAPAAPVEVLPAATPEPATQMVAGATASRDIACIPRELPPAAYRFFGRKEERRQLTERLRSGLNTAVVGSAGLGKTALAAVALADVMGAGMENFTASPFPDGIVYLDLYTFKGQAEPAWSVLANRLHGPEFMERHPARDRAAEACRARRILVIIEGGEEANGSTGRTTIPELFSVLSPENRWLLLTRVSTQSAVEETVSIRRTLDPEEAGEMLDWLTGSRPLNGDVRQTVLELLEGHPLAINWAGNLLAREEEDPMDLVEEWQSGRLPSLSDPKIAEHTLQWLYDRSVRDLDETARQALLAAGLLARSAFPADAIRAALGESEAGREGGNAVQGALKSLVQRGLLRRLEGDRWQFSHVLGYRFARDEDGSDPGLRRYLGEWLRTQILSALQGGINEQDPVLLEHAAALLRTDHDQQLWKPLAEGLLYGIADRLEEMGRLDLTNLCLDAVAEWLSMLPESKAEEPFWLQQRSVHLVDHGDLLSAQGDLSSALSDYQEALKIAKQLAALDPSNATWQRELSVSYNKLGDVAVARGKLEEAASAYTQALEIAKNLSAGDPSNTQWQRDLSVSYDMLGNVAVARGKLEEAASAYTQALEIAKNLSAGDPSNTQWQRDLSVSYDMLGDVAVAQGKLEEAASAYTQALEIRKKLAAGDPSNTQWQRDLSVSYNMLGNVAVAQGKLEEAASAYTQALEIAKKLAAGDPSNTQWQRDLSVYYNKLGDVAVARGKLEEAASAYTQALEIRKNLSAGDPSNTQWQRDLSVSYERLGDVAVTRGKLDEAASAYTQALEIAKNLAAGDPSNTQWQRDLSVSYDMLGNVAVARGKLEEAASAYTQALEIAKNLSAGDPSNTQWQRDLSVSYDMLGNVAVARGKLEEAASAYTQDLEIAKNLAAGDPSNTQWQRDLSVSYERLGNVAVARGKLEEAASAYTQALEIAKNLAAGDPSNTAWQRDLSYSFTKIAELNDKRGDLAEALRYAEKSLAINERLAMLDPSNATWRKDLEVSRNLVERLKKGTR